MGGKSSRYDEQAIQDMNSLSRLRYGKQRSHYACFPGCCQFLQGCGNGDAENARAEHMHLPEACIITAGPGGVPQEQS
ncbi:protein Njmu-R1 [Lates japonicus]|uniref:Protein Njmu-R1 n=1 Tax=Lates japonicus TaxID=270547 RepID=A0AAD3RFG6_LATJO|nr:protein Njmu-R1 [Lates japonicus]